MLTARTQHERPRAAQPSLRSRLVRRASIAAVVVSIAGLVHAVLGGAGHQAAAVAWWLVVALAALLVLALGALRTSRARAAATTLRMTEALRRERARLRALHDASPLGIFVADADGVCTYTNQRFEQITARDREASIGDGWLQGAHPGDLDRVLAAWRGAVQGVAAFHETFRLCRPDGSQVWVSVRAARALRDGRVIGFLGTVEDITQERAAHECLREYADDLTKAHEELKTARAVAEGAAAAKGRFLASISHEIRTPMTAILGFGRLLAEGDSLDEEARGQAAAILRNGEHMLRLVNDLLDLAKIEAGKMTVEQLDRSIVELVADVEETLRHRALDKGLRLEVVWRSDLPETLRTDPTRVRQILLNLVGNAIKFTAEGSVRIEVGCRGTGGGPGRERLHVCVVDTGPGLSEQQLATVFQPYAQAELATSRKHGGTGLGLAISRDLAGLLGGALTARGAPGQGCTFELELPIAAAEDVRWVDPGSQARRLPAVRPRPALPQLDARVLLVDDGIDNQRLLSVLLRRAGAEVEVAGNGRQAIDAVLAEQAAGRPFDLVLMDVQMPELDGLEATQRLRTAGVTTPIVALSASALPQDREQSLAAGCDEFLAKPIEQDRFFATCANLLLRDEPARSL